MPDVVAELDRDVVLHVSIRQDLCDEVEPLDKGGVHLAHVVIGHDHIAKRAEQRCARHDQADSEDREQGQMTCPEVVHQDIAKIGGDTLMPQRRMRNAHRPAVDELPALMVGPRVDEGKVLLDGKLAVLLSRQWRQRRFVGSNVHSLPAYDLAGSNSSVRKVLGLPPASPASTQPTPPPPAARTPAWR
jgi:hypothetical protein